MNSAQRDVNFSELMKRLLSLLTPKEKDIVERRFSLGGQSRETLDKIGKSYSITRERVRQIESVAIKKLARISMDPSMRMIHDLAHSILVEHGKIMSEDLLVSAMLKELKNPQEIDVNAVKLAMCVSDKLVKQDKNQFFRPFWRTEDVSLPEVKDLIKKIKSTLEKKQDVLDLSDLSAALSPLPAARVASALEIDWGFMVTENGWGLKAWRFINPRSIKDKIMVTLRDLEKPLHFKDIIHNVLNDFQAKKTVTPQAIHNELIRHDDFVLVGRGLYGLKEWGMTAGTVCDVIKTVLKEHGEPMKRQDIISEVLKKREIRLGTISLNLQKYPFFRRVGRAVYTYDSELDNGRLRRGRAPKAS